jgi:hypothetical protein
MEKNKLPFSSQVSKSIQVPISTQTFIYRSEPKIDLFTCTTLVQNVQSQGFSVLTYVRRLFVFLNNF